MEKDHDMEMEEMDMGMGMDVEMKSLENQTELNLCEHPSLNDYYVRMTPFLLLSIFISVLLVLLNILIFFTTVAKLRKRIGKGYLKSSIALCSLYSIISIAACTTILVPHLWLACHTVMHLSFTIGAVIFRYLCFRYVDHEVNYIKETDGNAVAINTPPCCCCCMCLPLVVPSKLKFTLLRVMVWQMPIVQGSIMFVLNGIYYKERSLYDNVMMYFIPFIISSILIGLWALNITVRMINAIRPDYLLMKKLFCLQLILLLCKLQYLVMDNLLTGYDFGGVYPATNTIHKQTIINLVILVEMVLVSILVQNAYKAPVQVTEMTSITK